MIASVRLLLVASWLVVGSAHAAPAAKPASSPASLKAAAPVDPKGKSGGSRTLDDIHIEGEIPVPQVLFITARDQRRFMEFQHRRYLRTSRQLGDDTPLPSRIVLNRVAPTQAKEISR